KLLSAIEQLTLEKIPNPTVPDQKVYEVLVALEKMGYISNHTTGRYIGNKIARGEIVQKLIDKKPRLMVDIVFLQTLQDMDCLDAADEVFRLLAFNSEFDLIKNEQQALKKRQEAAEWRCHSFDRKYRAD
ncbi:MAG: hypothetical protein QME73_10205, partial [Bacillota bacterium]|nr:hypothetical protein [Bacillota bacterium]